MYCILTLEHYQFLRFSKRDFPLAVFPMYCTSYSIGLFLLSQYHHFIHLGVQQICNYCSSVDDCCAALTPPWCWETEVTWLATWLLTTSDLQHHTIYWSPRPSSPTTQRAPGFPRLPPHRKEPYNINQCHSRFSSIDCCIVLEQESQVCREAPHNAYHRVIAI